MTNKPRWFVRGDIDGFFGLFIDNLLQLMLIQVLLTKVVPIGSELITGRILPAAAISIATSSGTTSITAGRSWRETGRAGKAESVAWRIRDGAPGYSVRDELTGGGRILELRKRQNELQPIFHLSQLAPG